jgi:hypothetical protein
MTLVRFVIGGLVGVCVAPGLLSHLKGFGVDRLSFTPAAPVILCCALVGAFALRKPGPLLIRILLVLLQ